MGLSGRTGLAVTGVAGNKLAAVDVNQMAGHRLAISRFLAERLGGEGLYSGGATVIGDIADGTDYPAFEAIVLDDSGNAWPFRKTTATEMTFADTSGACTAYLVIGQVSGVSPAMATGGLTDFTILVQLTATAAPAHSLALGAGSVTASAFTDWTPATGLFVDTLTRNGTRIIVGATAPGTPAAGDLWWDTANRMWWTYDGTATSWLGQLAAMPFITNRLPSYTETLGNVALLRLPTDWDVYLDQVDITGYGAAGTWDVSNYWTVNLYKVGTLIDSVDIDAAGLSHLTIPVAEVIDVSSFPYLRLDLVETGSPGNLTDFLMATATLRLVRT